MEGYVIDIVVGGVGQDGEDVFDWVVGDCFGGDDFVGLVEQLLGLVKCCECGFDFGVVFVVLCLEYVVIVFEGGGGCGEVVFGEFEC